MEVGQLSLNCDQTAQTIKTNESYDFGVEVDITAACRLAYYSLQINDVGDTFVRAVGIIPGELVPQLLRTPSGYAPSSDVSSFFFFFCALVCVLFKLGL